MPTLLPINFCENGLLISFATCYDNPHHTHALFGNMFYYKIKIHNISQSKSFLFVFTYYRTQPIESQYLHFCVHRQSNAKNSPPYNTTRPCFGDIRPREMNYAINHLVIVSSPQVTFIRESWHRGQICPLTLPIPSASVTGRSGRGWFKT